VLNSSLVPNGRSISIQASPFPPPFVFTLRPRSANLIEPVALAEYFLVQSPVFFFAPQLSFTPFAAAFQSPFPSFGFVTALFRPLAQISAAAEFFFFDAPYIDAAQSVPLPPLKPHPFKTTLNPLARSPNYPYL